MKITEAELLILLQTTIESVRIVCEGGFWTYTAAGRKQAVESIHRKMGAVEIPVQPSGGTSTG